MRDVKERSSAASVAWPSEPEPFEFALSKKPKPHEISSVPKPLLGLEREYQDIHYTPPLDENGEYEYLEKEILSCTKEKDARGNHLLKIVGEGQFLDVSDGNDGNDHACLEVVTAPLTYAQWRDKNGVLKAFQTIQALKQEMKDQPGKSRSLQEFINAYNKRLEESGAHRNFELTVPNKRYGDMQIDIGNKRHGISTQSNFTMPFEKLEKNYTLLEDLTAGTKDTKNREVDRQKRRAEEARQAAREIVKRFFSEAGKSEDLNENKLTSFIFLLILLESTYAQEFAIKPKRIVKFMYPWLSKATLIDVVYSSLTRSEASLLGSFLERNNALLHDQVNKIAQIKLSDEKWTQHISPITQALDDRLKQEKRSALEVVDNDDLKSEEGERYSGFLAPQDDGRIPPLDVNGISNIVIEARSASLINKIPTADELQLLRELNR